jgi:hypothetical protein
MIIKGRILNFAFQISTVEIGLASNAGFKGAASPFGGSQGSPLLLLLSLLAAASGA